jgi:hypothetical protein
MGNVPELKPCPFCGSLAVAVAGSFVRRGTCDGAGPYGYSDAEAVYRWNERRVIVPAGQDVSTDVNKIPGEP